MSRWVVHCKKEPYDVYIGRVVPRSGFKASIWGNPFKLGKDGTREEIMAKYLSLIHISEPTRPY